MENNLKATHDKLENLLCNDLYTYSLDDDEVEAVLKQLLAIVEPTVKTWKARHEEEEARQDAIALTKEQAGLEFLTNTGLTGLEVHCHSIWGPTINNGQVTLPAEVGAYIGQRDFSVRMDRHNDSDSWYELIEIDHIELRVVGDYLVAFKGGREPLVLAHHSSRWLDSL